MIRPFVNVLADEHRELPADGYQYLVAARFHDIRRVVSDFGVFDFETPDRRMRLASVHPGVAVADVVAATGFELAIPDDVPVTRSPTGAELALLRGELA